MKLLKLVFFIILTSVPDTLLSTTQCPPGVECEAPPEIKISILAYLDNLLEHCSALQPKKTNEYRKKYSQLQEKLYKDMEEHPMYDDVMSAYKEVVDNMSERSIKRECKSVLRVMNDEIKTLED